MWYTMHIMIPQNSKVMPMLLIAMVVAVFAFSLYVFLTTENTVIVVNEAASEPKEVIVTGSAQPKPEVEQPELNPRIRILETGVGFLNVRENGSMQAKQVGRVLPGEVYEYTQSQNNWYKIVHPEFPNAWVSGQYIEVVDRSSDLMGGE